MSTATDEVLVHRAGAALTLTLNRPAQKNALTGAMIGTIIRAVEDASVDDRTRVIVLAANGSDFCSGIDLVQANRRKAPDPGGGEGGDPPTRPRTGHLQRGLLVGAHRMIQVLDSVQLPVIAGVRGYAAGVGNMLALSADVVVASETARFWVPFVTKGFTPDSGTTWLLPRLVGMSRAKEMVLRGKPISGERAAGWGLVSECVPDDHLDAAVASVTGELADAATVSLGLAKTLLHRNLEVGLTTALQNEGVYEELAVRTDDFKEGMRAFADKRGASYTGR